MPNYFPLTAMSQIVRHSKRIAPFMSCRSSPPSPSPSPRPTKRAKLDHLVKDDFKNGVFLAPMVRSGARMLEFFLNLLELPLTNTA